MNKLRILLEILLVSTRLGLTSLEVRLHILVISILSMYAERNGWMRKVTQI